MDKCKYFGFCKIGMTSTMMFLIIGIILVLIMVAVFFPSTLKIGDFLYKYGCEGWTSLMNALYDALGMPPATAC